MNYVLDTNVVIYAQKGVLVEPLPLGRFFVSVITEIELLSFHGLTADQDCAVREMLADVTIVEINPSIKSMAISIRRRYRLRIPDAIIAATGMVVEAELLTNDSNLNQVVGLRHRNLKLKQG